MIPRTLILIALLAPLAVAQEQKPDTVSFAGKVISADGKPVAGAAVELRSDAVGRDQPGADVQGRDDLMTSVATNERGEFSLSDVTLPTLVGSSRARDYVWYLVARAPGHGPGWVGLSFHRGGWGELTLALSRTAKIAGRAVDSEGKPVAGAEVRAANLALLKRPASPDQYGGPTQYLGLMRAKHLWTTRTDAAGRFVLEGLPAEARMQVQIKHEGHVAEWVYVATTSQPQVAEISRWADSRGELRVRELPVHVGDFTVTLTLGRTLKGQVLFADTGKPAAKAKLSLQADESGHYFPVTTDDDGRFTLKQLPVSSFACTVRPPDKSDYVSTTAEVAIAKEQMEVEQNFKLPRGAVIAGKVADEETDKGIGGVTVFYNGAGQAAGAPTVAVVTEADGSFRLAASPGAGRLMIAGQVAGYVLPIQPAHYARSQEEREGPFTKAVEAKLDTPVRDVTFKLGRGLTVTGRALDGDGKPVSGAKLVRLDDYNADWDRPVATTDADGQFTLKTLDPSRKYEFIVQHDQRRLAATLKLAKDKKPPESLEVRLEPLGVVKGRVLDEEKKPLAGALVHAYVTITLEQDGATYMSQFSPYGNRQVKTDKEGRFTVDFLVAGYQHQVYAQNDGYTQGMTNQFPTRGGQPHDVGDLTLIKADQSVAGSVVDPAGRPIAGVQVYVTSRLASSSYNSDQAVTDKDGRFKFTKLPRGTVEINAISERDSQGIGMSNRVNAPTGKDDVRIVMFLRRKLPVAALVGKPAPEFPVATWLNQRTSTGKKALERGDFQGKVLLLAFVDEARPSQRVLPRLQALQEKLGDNLVVLRVHEFGDQDDLRKLSPLPAALVSSGLVPVGFSDAHERYGVRATPTLFLIDKQGVLRHVDVAIEQAEELVKRLQGS